MTALEEQRDLAGRSDDAGSHTGQTSEVAHSAPRVDLKEARKFLSFLDPQTEAFYFRTFDESKRGGGSGRNYFGTLDELAVELQLDNGNGRGVFVVVNDGGHRAHEITRVRAIYGDFDGTPLPEKEALALDFHLIVESSPQRYHAYMRVNDMPLQRFKETQQAVAARYGSDPAVCDLSRVMRVPGFMHCKPADGSGHDGRPFRSRIIHESGGAPYSADRVLAAFRAVASVAVSAPRLADGTSSHVVLQDRHADLLRLAGREARSVVFDGVSRDAALAKLRVEVNRGRYSRAVPDDEIQRALDGAIAKCRSGEWQPALETPAVAQPKAQRTVAFRRASDLIANPRPLAWLIRDILELDSFALMFADPGVGKTFVALDIAYSVACGTDWHGRRTSAGPVFYIAGEGGNGLGRRLRALELARGREIGDAPLFVSTVPASLTDAQGAGEALAAVDAMVDEHGKPSLIVLDTVARNFGGGDENSTRDMTAFVSACDQIRHSTGACVLLIHHSGHGDKSRARGSIALKGALDWEYGLIREGKTLTLQCTKAKDAEPPSPIAFRLKPVDLGLIDEDGEPITSAALAPAMYVKPSAAGRAGRGKNQTAALRLLKEGLAAAAAKLQAAGLDPDTASIELRAWRDACAAEGINSRRFPEICKSLHEAGLATVREGRVTAENSVEFDPE